MIQVVHFIILLLFFDCILLNVFVHGWNSPLTHLTRKWLFLFGNAEVFALIFSFLAKCIMVFPTTLLSLVLQAE